MQSPAFDQTDFRGRNDDGSETSATWIAATNTGWSRNYSNQFRVRLAVAEVNGARENNVGFQLQYNQNSTGWTNVTGSSSVVQAASSSNVSDATTTTQQITSNTFVSGYVDTTDGAVQQGISYNGGETTEVEFSVQFVGADVSQDDVIQFRVIRADGTLLGTYTNVPSVTVTGFIANDAGSITTSLATTGTATLVANLGGTCTKGGVGVSGARVFVVRTDTETVEANVTTDSNGNWSVTVPAGSVYHVTSQYDDGVDQFNEFSAPFLVT